MPASSRRIIGCSPGDSLSVRARPGGRATNAVHRALRADRLRASPADLAFLAMDTGAIPEQFAVILILEQLGDFGLRG